MKNLTLNDIEKLFEEFQHDDVVEKKKSATVGMLVSGNCKQTKYVCEVVEMVDDLVSSSERQGFKFGFKLALQIASKRSNNPVTNIKEYINLNKSLDKMD